MARDNRRASMFLVGDALGIYVKSACCIQTTTLLSVQGATPMQPVLILAKLNLATVGLPSPWGTIGLVLSTLITLGIFAALFITSRQLGYRALLKKEAFDRVTAAYEGDVQSLSYEIETPARLLPAPTPEPEVQTTTPVTAEVSEKKARPAKAKAEATDEAPRTKRVKKKPATQAKQPAEADA